MSTDKLDDIWKDAVDKYESATGSKLSIGGLSNTELSPDAILDLVEQTQASLGAKRSRVWGALEPICTFVMSVTEVLGDSVKLIYPPAEAIFRALHILLNSAKGISSNYDAIAEMLQGIHNLISRLSVYCEIQVSPSIRTSLVDTLAHVLVMLGLGTKLIKEARPLTFVKTLIGKDSKLHDALKKFDKLCAHEEQVATIETLSVTNKILVRLEEVLESGKTSDDHLKEMLLDVAKEARQNTALTQESMALLEGIKGDTLAFMLEQNQRNVRNWIGAPDLRPTYEEARNRRTPGTGAWLLRDEHYVDWKQCRTQDTIWLNDGPGCGKSVLSSTIVEDLSIECQGDPSRHVTYYYFTFRDSHLQTAHALLLCLIDQLAFANPKTFAVVHGKYTKRSDQQRLSYEECFDVLKNMREHLEHVYLIIDALDECTEWPKLEKALSVLMSCRLQILVTSRREKDIIDYFTSAVSIHLESHVVDADIALYVDSVLSEDPRFRRWRNREPEKKDIRETLTARANGMFRWAYCQMESLAGCISSKLLQQALKNLPATLYETYDRILLNIDFDYISYARTILIWLSYAREPMTIEGIAEALAIDMEAEPPYFEISNRLPDAQDILRICASLVRSTQDGKLELAHFSVKEYLTVGLQYSENRKMLPESQRSMLSKFHLDADTGHTFIARALLVYVTYVGGISGRYDEMERSLCEYASSTWIRRCQNGLLHDIESEALAFFQKEDAYAFWVDRYDEDLSRWRIEDPVSDNDTAPPLYYAALVGFTKCITELILYGADVNAIAGDYRSALAAASLRGHEQTVKLLLDCGADVNAAGGHYGSALAAASLQGHEQIVMLLLNRGADVNAVGGYRGSALEAASSGGHEQIVKLLLDRGADFNAVGGHYGPALRAASYGGHEQIVKLLLNCGADINAPHGLALAAASYGGHEQIVKLLLDRGADINTGETEGFFTLSLEEKHEMWKCVAEILSESIIKYLSDEKIQDVKSGSYDDLALIFRSRSKTRYEDTMV